MSSSLLLEDVGENYCGVPVWMDESELLEMTAERLGAKGWEKRPGMVRNESIDHLVQARAQHIFRGGEKVDWSSPPNWARDVANNINAVKLDGEESPTVVQAPVRRRRIPRKLF
jgi:phage terminase large subunit GpA-like protein